MILQDAYDEAQKLEPPPMFTKSLVYMDDFDPKHMGAKSINLKVLRGKMNQDIRLPESCTIPFQVFEYTLKNQPKVEKAIQSYLDRIQSIKSVKKMNKILFRCKELVLGLSFQQDD